MASTVCALAHYVLPLNYVVCCTAYEMEPISAIVLGRALPKPVTPFYVGLSVDLPPSTPQAKPTTPVSEFLDRAYTELGAHSMIYVAFGTTFFSLSSSVVHLTVILKENIAQGFRLIFTLSSLSAKGGRLGSEWMDKLIQSGNAIFPEWTDQTSVVGRLAIHNFLSHGGWSLSTEAFVRGVPMISWPFVVTPPLLFLTHQSGKLSSVGAGINAVVNSK